MLMTACATPSTGCSAPLGSAADEWLQCGYRYMQIAGMAELSPPLIDTELGKLPPLAA